MFEHDCCILGTGRVGLPLGLSLMEQGLRVVGVDVDERLRDLVNAGRMPFDEPGYDELVASRGLVVHGEPEVVARSRFLVITVGTPLHEHVETDLSQVTRVLEGMAPHLRPGHLVCLRSTVGPGTTRFVGRWIERNTPLRIGEDVALAFCPERIAEGKARDELRTLPQVIGVEDALSEAAARELFGHLAPELLVTDTVTAELVKLFNNIARYVHFALANQFALICDTFGANIYETRRLANYKYPRSQLAAPGLTAGTCLRKDFGMINEWSPYPDMLLAAWKMNEYAPAFLVDHLMKRTPLHDRRVAILGYSFKADTDDIRDSLVPKLFRYVQRQLPTEIKVSDHNLPPVIEDPVNGPVANHPSAEALADADCVFVAINHSGYGEALRELAVARPEVWVADIWNVGGIEEVFYRAGDLVAKDAAP